MHFVLTDEQRMLQESVDRFVERDYDFEHRRALTATDQGFSDEHWKTFAELGWLGVPFPEEQGGYGGGLVEAGLILEGLGRGLVVEPYLWTVVVGGGLLSLAGRDDLLAEVVAGDLQLAFGFAEPQSRFDLADVTTRADEDGGGFKLAGHKAVVFNAPAAGRIIVPARTGGGQREAAGISLFLVDPSADGVSLRGYPTVDGLRAAEVALDGVSVGADAMLGDEGAALPWIETVVDRATAAVCCEAAGIMQTMVASTQEYLKTRNQFGVPLAKFQVLQHRMAELFIHKEQAQSMAYMAVVRAGQDDATVRARSASAAKTFIGDKGRAVGQESIQMHGGMGVTDEMPISHYFKRLTMIDTLFGNADFHRRRFAELSGSAEAA
jgi:alkylation response protein AidB-like acyl-CoA dehydrogenase